MCKFKHQYFTNNVHAAHVQTCLYSLVEVLRLHSFCNIWIQSAQWCGFYDKTHLWRWNRSRTESEYDTSDCGKCVPTSAATSLWSSTARFWLAGSERRIPTMPLHAALRFNKSLGAVPTSDFSVMDWIAVPWSFLAISVRNKELNLALCEVSSLMLAIEFEFAWIFWNWAIGVLFPTFRPMGLSYDVNPWTCDFCCWSTANMEEGNFVISSTSLDSTSFDSSGITVVCCVLRA